jgi:hypothetical protein
LQAVAERNGLTLDVGDVDDDLVPEVMQVEDGPQPKVIAARLAAHLGHRIPGLRKLEKRAEGKDKASGVLSDMGVLLGQLYYRNKDEIHSILGDLISGKLTTQKRSKGSNGQVQPGDRVDFGAVGTPVPSQHNDGG